MEIFTKNNVVHMLQNNVVTVKFTKVSGEERTMRCTLLPEYMPTPATSGGKTLLQEDAMPNNVSVWDVDSGGWRSFRVDSVKSITVG
jgi:WYL_2, Sm-like SH3 beta-barrel fold